MPRMNLTAAEAQRIKANRRQIELDSRDWSKEPHVTCLELYLMSPHTARRIVTDHHWQLEPMRQVWFNTRFEVMADELEDIVLHRVGDSLTGTVLGFPKRSGGDGRGRP